MCSLLEADCGHAQAGSIISATASGCFSRLVSYISCSLRPPAAPSKSLPSVSISPCANHTLSYTITIYVVYEGKIQEEQQQRVEREIEEDPTPVSPTQKSTDKDSAFHIEAVSKEE